MKEIEEKIRVFHEDVIHYSKILNDSGTWLFLAVIACWSVPSGIPRLVAVVSIVSIFAYQVFSGVKRKKPFHYRIKDIEKEIDESSLDKIEKESLKWRLLQVKQNNLGFSRIFTKVPAYFISGLFLLFSAYYWMN